MFFQALAQACGGASGGGGAAPAATATGSERGLGGLGGGDSFFMPTMPYVPTKRSLPGPAPALPAPAAGPSGFARAASARAAAAGHGGGGGGGVFAGGGHGAAAASARRAPAQAAAAAAEAPLSLPPFGGLPALGGQLSPEMAQAFASMLVSGLFAPGASAHGGGAAPTEEPRDAEDEEAALKRNAELARQVIPRLPLPLASLFVDVNYYISIRFFLTPSVPPPPPLFCDRHRLLVCASS